MARPAGVKVILMLGKFKGAVCSVMGAQNTELEKGKFSALWEPLG